MIGEAKAPGWMWRRRISLSARGVGRYLGAAFLICDEDDIIWI